MEKELLCSICNHQIADTFCSHCGQKHGKKRTTTFSLISDFLSNFFSIDNSIFATFFLLLKSPSKVINNYADGNRRYYPSPGKVVIFVITVTALHFLFVDASIFGFTLRFQKTVSGNSHWFLFVMSVGFMAVTSYLTYYRRKFNFAKHLITVLYLWSTFFFICLILSDTFHFLLNGNNLGSNWIPIQIILVLIYNAIVFSERKKLYVVVANLLLHILVIIVSVILVGLILQQVNILSLSSS